MGSDAFSSSTASSPIGRKAMPAGLHYGQDMVLALLESAAQAIVAIDRDGRIALANRKAEEMFGYAREELLGSPVEMLLPESRRSVHWRKREEYFSQRSEERRVGKKCR